MNSYFSFKFRHSVRKTKRSIHAWRIWFFNYINRHLYGGWKKLGEIKWMVTAMILVFIVATIGIANQMASANTHYLTLAPRQGGSYAEAVDSKITSVNPLFADNSASDDAAKLVFSGLTRINSQRQVDGDLATSWDISADKKTYTFHLRPGVKWHDGAPFTADDVAFTISRVQNPDTRSGLASNWTNVTTQVIDPLTIQFNLPASYGPFLSNATLGILPKHILENVRPSLLKTQAFNQKPIGTGPYKLTQLDPTKQYVDLQANSNYYLGAPNITKFQFVEFSSNDEYLEGYAKAQVQGFAISKPSLLAKVDKIETININHLNLPAYAGAFFNMKSANLADPRLRQALAYATDKNSIVQNQLHNQAIAVPYPILAGYSGFDANVPRYSYSLAQAQDLAAQIGAEKLKDTTIVIATLKDSNYEAVAEALKKMWEPLGIHVVVNAMSLGQLQQTAIRPRNYDVLLYGQDLGIDSDVYSYWHSSQVNDPGLNVSNYSNAEVDKQIEGGRIAKDPAYKQVRYSGFLQAWSKDLPAIILYTPFYNYALSDEVHGFSAKKITEPSDRFYNIQNWYINSTLQPKANVKK
jgi:peptide/nickel transport system substrate-binding protein